MRELSRESERVFQVGAGTEGGPARLYESGAAEREPCGGWISFSPSWEKVAIALALMGLRFAGRKPAWICRSGPLELSSPDSMRLKSPDEKKLDTRGVQQTGKCPPNPASRYCQKSGVRFQVREVHTKSSRDMLQGKGPVDYFGPAAGASGAAGLEEPVIAYCARWPQSGGKRTAGFTPSR